MYGLIKEENDKSLLRERIYEPLGQLEQSLYVFFPNTVFSQKLLGEIIYLKIRHVVK